MLTFAEYDPLKFREKSLKQPETAPRAPTTTGIILVFIFHRFSNFILKFWHIVIFSSSFSVTLLSPGIDTSTRVINFSILSTTGKSSLRAFF